MAILPSVLFTLQSKVDGTLGIVFEKRGGGSSVWNSRQFVVVTVKDRIMMAGRDPAIADGLGDMRRRDSRCG